MLEQMLEVPIDQSVFFELLGAIFDKWVFNDNQTSSFKRADTSYGLLSKFDKAAGIVSLVGVYEYHENIRNLAQTLSTTIGEIVSFSRFLQRNYPYKIWTEANYKTYFGEWQKCEAALDAQYPALGGVALEPQNPDQAMSEEVAEQSFPLPPPPQPASNVAEGLIDLATCIPPSIEVYDVIKFVIGLTEPVLVTATCYEPACEMIFERIIAKIKHIKPATREIGETEETNAGEKIPEVQHIDSELEERMKTDYSIDILDREIIRVVQLLKQNGPDTEDETVAAKVSTNPETETSYARETINRRRNRLREKNYPV